MIAQESELVVNFMQCCVTTFIKKHKDRFILVIVSQLWSDNHFRALLFCSALVDLMS